MSDAARILAFDTAAAHCAAALLVDGQCIASAHEEMARGQAERLMGLLEDVLAEAGMDWRGLDAIGVGIGPGNFTGIRLSVAAARGLALGLGIPAIGVSSLEVVGEGHAHVLACVRAPRDQVYAQRFRNGAAVSDPALVDRVAGPFPVGDETPAPVVAGHDATGIATALGLRAAESVAPPAEAIARLARLKFDQNLLNPPAPLYIKPADAAPPREAPPVILDA
jgi:tRNA threonylcarbamoyl adenosine modification protein YeaZ